MKNKKLADLESIYSNLGGKLITPIEQLRERITKIRLLVFDWDGVFNSGTKGKSKYSTFCEPDMMGINLLRYSLYLSNLKSGKDEKEAMPKLVIITGQKNENAELVALRERYNAIYFRSIKKQTALNHFCESQNISTEEIGFFFDDVLDLSIAERSGIRILIKRKNSPLFEFFCIENNCVDYITSDQGGNYALREATELLIALLTDINHIFRSRINFDDEYQHYLKHLSTIETKFYECSIDEIREQDKNNS